MGKFLELMERIVNGAPTTLGFGAARAPKVPSMALIALVSARHATGLKTAAVVAPDVTLLAGVKGPEALADLKESLPAVPWGLRTNSLSEAEAQSYREQGCDLLAFPLDGTAAAALDGDELGRVICLESGMEEPELRAIDVLPVDAVLLNMTAVSGPWTLRDLMVVGGISRRLNKFVLVEVAQPPAKKELEALRDLGVRGLVLDISSTTTESLTELKSALLELPRHRPQRRDRAAAILPGSIYAAAHAPAPGHEEEEEEDDDP